MDLGGTHFIKPYVVSDTGTLGTMPLGVTEYSMHSIKV
jgi:hypothetical protein